LAQGFVKRRSSGEAVWHNDHHHLHLTALTKRTLADELLNLTIDKLFAERSLVFCVPFSKQVMTYSQIFVAVSDGQYLNCQELVLKRLVTAKGGLVQRFMVWCCAGLRGDFH
jgi:hypothetical protein